MLYSFVAVKEGVGDLTPVVGMLFRPYAGTL